MMRAILLVSLTFCACGEGIGDDDSGTRSDRIGTRIAGAEAMTSISEPLMQDLAASTDLPSVSVYLPIPLPGTEPDRARITLRNQKKDLRDRLEGFGSDLRRQVFESLEPLEERLSSAQPGTLVAFASPKRFELLALPHELEPRVEVGSKFLLTPMLQPEMDLPPLFVLALSLDHTRAYRLVDRRLERFSLSSRIPTSLVQARGWEVQGGDLQHHSFRATGQNTVYHGQGGGSDDRKTEIMEFFKRLDRGLRDEESLPRDPMLLVGVEYEVSLFQEVTHLRASDVPPLHLSPDGVRESELKARVVETATELARSRHREAWNELYVQLGTDRVSTGVQDVLQNAIQGKISELFVSTGASHRGSFVPSEDLHVNAEGSEDLINLAACLTLQHAGRVYARPEADPDVAALKRFG